MRQDYPAQDQINEILHNLIAARTENWLNHDLFSWQWFLLVFVTIAAWVIFWKLADKRRLDELLLYGMIIMAITINLDEIGTELLLWTYPIKIMPLFPRMIAVDHAAVPVIYTLVYQYFDTWKGFTWAMLGVAASFSFIAEPMLELMDLYAVDNWKHYYGIPIYVLMAVMSRYIVKKVYQIKQKHMEDCRK